MIRHIPRNTRIFIGLVIITLLTTYLAIALTDAYESQLGGQTIQQKIRQEEKIAQPPAIDTSGWMPYTDETYPITFSHPPDWKISASELDSDLYDIALAIPDSDQDIHIYVTRDGYVGMNGLNEKPYTVGTMQGSTVNGGLFGLKKGEYYYTFDASLHPQLEKEFTALVQTVKID